MTYKTSWSTTESRPWPRPGAPSLFSRRGRGSSLWARLAGLRPASPGQLAAVGGGLWLVGALVPAVHALVAIGIALLVIAAGSLLIRPRTQTMYWRGRKIELQRPAGTGERLYRLLYRAP